MKKNFFTNTFLSPSLKILSATLLIWGSTVEIMSQDKDVFPIPEPYKVEGIPQIKNSEVKDLVYDPSEIRSNLIWDADRKKPQNAGHGRKEYRLHVGGAVIKTNQPFG